MINLYKPKIVLTFTVAYHKTCRALAAKKLMQTHPQNGSIIFQRFNNMTSSQVQNFCNLFHITQSCVVTIMPISFFNTTSIF